MVGGYDDAMLAARPEVQSGSYDSYGATDLNIAYGEHYLTAAGLPMRWHQAPTSIGDAGSTYSDGTYGGTAPSALFYGGWYNIDAYAASAWDWLPGSVACDLDSSSLGADIRDPNDAAWGIQELQHGVTCVAGVIGEPYTSGHTRPNILLWAMVNGYTWAEATALANPAIGWKSYAIGDPLYRPFGPKTPVLDTQAPQLAGAPAVVGDGAGGVAVVATVADLAEPEVAQARVDYGATAAYGASVASPGYFKRHRLGLPGAGASFHYRVVLADPAGNTASSGDLVYPGGQTDQPPVGRIAASPSSGAAPLDVAFDGGASSDPDGAVVAYHWDFGDGSGADVAATHHQYAAAGTYTATLVVTDDGGAQGAATTTISVSGGGSGGSILFSDDFSSPSPDPAWTFVGASWSQAAGVLAQGSTQAGDPKKALLTDRAYPADVEVLARVRVDAWSAGDLARAGVGVAADGAGRGYNLVFHGDQQVQFLDDGVAWGNAYPFAWQVGTWYWFRLKRQGGVLSGKVWPDGAPEPSGWPYAQSGWSDRAGGAPGLNGGSAAAGLGASTASFDDVTVDAPSSVEPPLFADDFSGATLAGAWSAAGSGGAWSAADGAAHQTSTADGDPKKLVLAGDYPSDVEIRARVRVDTWTTGDYARAGVGLRTDPATGEGYNLVFHGDQTVQFLDDRIAWGNAFPFAWQVGAWYWFALKIEGGTLSGKVWADGAPEPSGWPYVQSGWTSRAAGQPALNGGSASAGLGAATASFDDVEIDAIAPGGTGARERTDTDGEAVSGGAVGPRAALCRQDP